MDTFRYYHTIEVRYGDLDSQGHVNNSRYLTYIEQARVFYIQHLGLWDGRSLKEIGFILADAHITYRSPILFGQVVRVGVRFARLGNKSMIMEYSIEDDQLGDQMATATTVQVAYDYHSQKTIPIPDTWRQKISQFEELEPSSKH